MAKSDRGSNVRERAGNRTPAVKRSLPTIAEMQAAATQASAMDDLDLAQDKAFDAMDAGSRSRRQSLALAALAISPLCADAYAILARETKETEQRIALLRQAVEAGTLALGKAGFKEYHGNFWGFLETRPYMRARHELALELSDVGERNEAIAHYLEMLELNPNDNQGVRYCLIDDLLFLGRNQEADALLTRYAEDGSAVWAWSRALLRFREEGDSEAARATLAEALKSNEYVAAYLTRKTKIPQDLPDYVEMGGEDEAAGYVMHAAPGWTATPGALAWVEANCDGSAVAFERGHETDMESRIDDAILALLLLGLHDGRRAWKTFDWETLDRLHVKGYISNPATSAKSITFSATGLKMAQEKFGALFDKNQR